MFYPIEKFFSRLTDLLITITYEDYKLANQKFHCKIKHIHGVGVNQERFHPVDRGARLKLKTELGFRPEEKIILCVGELLPNKNQKMAIHMMKGVVKRFPDAKLLLVGNGPEKENLEAEIIDCGLQGSVIMLGYCTYLEKYQCITDVVVACSYREGLPLNLVEAMLAGNPVVASVNRGHKELIKNGVNGFLVDNAKEMCDKVIKLIENTVNRESVGETAQIYAREYGDTNVKKELEAIYFQ